jgi:hypothetical protein
MKKVFTLNDTRKRRANLEKKNLFDLILHF